MTTLEQVREHKDPVQIGELIRACLTNGTPLSKVAERFEMSVTTAHHYLKMLQLPYRYRGMVKQGKIPMKTARAFVRRADSPMFDKHFQTFIDHKLNSTHVERYTEIMRRHPEYTPQEVIDTLKEGYGYTLPERDVDLTVRSGKLQDCERCGGKIIHVWGQRQCANCSKEY